mmetsp:Transcript_17994/g.63217  ORF Transcript_17994/g.63217 Transcript_17994/m.63217 type:complete len:511 (+) Transcript_17994:239-1771(+)
MKLWCWPKRQHASTKERHPNALNVLGLLPQGPGLLQAVLDAHLAEEHQPAGGTDQRRRVLVEPLVTQASLDHVVLLHLYALAHVAERALDLVRRKLRVALGLEAAQELMVQRGDGLQRDRDDGGDLVRLEAAPNIAVSPNGEVLDLLLVEIPLRGSSDRLEYLVVRVRAGGLGIKGHRDNLRLHLTHKLQDRKHVAVVRGLRGEDVGRVETQSQVRDVGELPADVAPDALGLELTARPLQGLHLGDVLLARVAALEVGAQLTHPRQQRRSIRLDDLPIDVAEVVNEAARGALVPQLSVCGSDSVQEFPDVTAAEVQRGLARAAGRVIALRDEALPRRRAQELLDAAQHGQHVLVGHRVEAARAADEVVLVGGHARVSVHCRQVAQHDVVVVRLGVQERRVAPGLATVLNLRDERVPHHRGQLLQGSDRPPHRASRQWARGHIVGGEVDEPLAQAHGQVDQHMLDHRVVHLLQGLERDQLPLGEQLGGALGHEKDCPRELVQSGSRVLHMR